MDTNVDAMMRWLLLRSEGLMISHASTDTMMSAYRVTMAHPTKRHPDIEACASTLEQALALAIQQHQPWCDRFGCA